MNHQDASYHLTDYVCGRLDASQRDDVAAAVAGSAELQVLEAWLRQVQRLFGLAGGALFGHPGGDQLVGFALDPDTADPAVAAHAVSCPTCREHVTRTRGVHDDLAASAQRRMVAWGRFLPGTVLGIAAGLALVLFSGLWRPDAEPVDGATRTLVVAAATRGDDPVATPRVDHTGLATITLLIEVNPYLEAPDGQTTVDVELLRAGEATWAWSGPAAAAWNPDLGKLSLMVPAGQLVPGPYEVLVRVAGQDVLQRTVEIGR